MKSFAVSDLITDRGDHPINEDCIGWSNRFAWVMDGASAIGSVPWIDSISDANWLVSQYETAIRELISPTISCRQLIRDAISIVASRAPAPIAESLLPNLAIGILKIESDGASFFGLGDVTISLVDSEGRVVTPLMGKMTKYDVSAIQKIQSLAASGFDIETAKEQVYAEIIRDRVTFMNKENGYWTISFEIDAVKHGVSGEAKMELSEAWLMTDGFRRYDEIYGLGPSLEESISQWRSTGLRRALSELRQVEIEDFDMKVHPRISISDDASCARLVARELGDD